MSRVYSLRYVQLLPVPLEKAWDFFSRPENLKNITPASLNFKMLNVDPGASMYPGQVIEYHVSPIAGIPIYWMTEITHAKHLEYFVDEQRFGPYSFWHHQHHFKETEKGVEMTDIVHYKIPFWFLGDIANSLFVRRQLEDIFKFRRTVTEKLFM